MSITYSAIKTRHELDSLWFQRLYLLLFSVILQANAELQAAELMGPKRKWN